MNNYASNTVFLCYSSFDQEKGSKLYSRLKHDGVNAWSVQEDLLPGQNPEIEVTKIIEKSKAVLICLSKKSKDEISQIHAYIKMAVKEASKRPEGDIFLIPLMLEECTPPFSLLGIIPAKLPEDNYLDDNGYKKLLFVLKGEPQKIDLTSSKIRQDNTSAEETMPDINHLVQQNEMISKAKEKELKFAVIGLTGAGKSSAINSLFGKKVAEVDPFVSTTHSVVKYSNESLGIKYSIFDTPGLGESENENLDIEYVNLIKKEIKEWDCMLYVTHLDNPRVGADEQRSIRIFSETFGQALWERAVIVFTLRYPLTADEFSKFVSKRTELIQNEIYKHVDKSITGEIPTTSISITSNLTPDNKEWITDLFLKIVNKVSGVSSLAFVLANANRIDSGEIPLSENQKDSLTSKFTPSQDEIKGSLALASLGVSTIAGSLLLFGGPVTAVLGVVAGIAGSLYVISQSEEKTDK